jgi:ATP-binding cassette subfamily B protein
MIVTSFVEVVSIGAVVPFLGALTAPDQIFVHPLAQPFVNALGLTDSKQVLLPLTIAFSTGALLAGLMRLILLWAQTRLSHSIGADFSISIYRRTLYQSYAVHTARNSSEVISGISNKANAVVFSIVMPVLYIVNSAVMLVAIVLVLLSIEPVIAITAFVGFGVIYVVVILVTKKALLRDSKRINEESNQVIKALQEGLGGIRDVLIDGTQDTYCDIFRKADIPLRRAIANVDIIGGCPRFVIEALGMVLIATLAYILVGRPAGVTSAIPILGVLALGAQRLLPALQQAYGGWTRIRGGQSSLEGVLDLLDQPLPDYASAISPPSVPFEHSITLNNLSFKYTKNTPWVLRPSLNLNIPKGCRIGFIGNTGSGKSTLLDIIMGLLQPTRGSLVIDGVEISEQNCRGWQAHLAHVPQTIFLADCSISENIAFGVKAEKIDHARVRQAAQKAQIAQTIESWSEQYSTLVGEQGMRLSGGQRQRIGIARALYKEADVIIFDEATSALDNATEQAVMESIENLSNTLTVIIVAHRLSTLKNCTTIVELADGEIVRVGDYQNIIERGMYHEKVISVEIAGDNFQE